MKNEERKRLREQNMPDADRVRAWQSKGRRCVYCNGERPVETITDRLLGCCNICAEWDNNAKVVMNTLPCICCGKQLTPEWVEEITVNTVNVQALNDGMASRISCGYGSSLDGNVYMIALCDNCAKQKQTEGRLTFVYNYIPNVDGSPKTC